MSDLTLPAINPAVLPMVPETLLIASEEKLWAGMERIVKMYGRNLPKGVEPGTAILLMLAAKEYGLNPLEAISNLFFIGGRIVPSANTMMRLATGNGLTIKPLIESDEEWKAGFSRVGRESITASWTIERARKAGLLGSDTWKKHPQAMLRARCISEAIRMYAGDLVKGIEYNAEELTNGTGYFDPAGNFTPDPSITGPEPEDKNFKLFEGRTEEKKPAPAKTPSKTERASKNVTAEVAATIGKPAVEAQVAETVKRAVEAAQAEEKEVEQAAGVEGKVITIARGEGNQVDFTKTIANIFAILKKTEGDEAKAKTKASELMKKIGVSNAMEMKGKVSFTQFFQLADEYAAEALSKPKEVAPVADFDPKRGARTKDATSDVQDAPEAPNYDMQILDFFADFHALDLDEVATRICEDSGYSDDGEDSPVSIKLETIRLLNEAKLAAIKNNEAAD